MRRSPGIPAWILAAALYPCPVPAAPGGEPPRYTCPEANEGLVGDLDGAGRVAKGLQDTIWIADWTFDAAGGGCTDAGWEKYDGHVLDTEPVYWRIDARFDGACGIAGNAAVLAKHDLCWASPDGYGNDWDYSLVCDYVGASTLTFDLLSDSEPGYDFVLVEVDSGGASEWRTLQSRDPRAMPTDYRDVIFATDGVNCGTITRLPLPAFGAPFVTHEVYIRFRSDGGYSDEDGLYTSTWHAGLVLDNIVVAGGLNYIETFECGLAPCHVASVRFMNSARSKPWGQWARLFPHATDNDRCTENTSCTWLYTDPTNPARYPDMSFGPGQAVVRKWLDDNIASPWVVLPATPDPATTLLSFRRFGGNRWTQGRIVQGWKVRSRTRRDNTDTPAAGDSLDCISDWRHAGYNSLNYFAWLTHVGDMTARIDPGAVAIQVRFQTIDYELLGDGPPITINSGPGPYLDRVRIGRRRLAGPNIEVGIDTRTQAQDCFPTVLGTSIPGEHYVPDGANRFGTCAFSPGEDVGYGQSSLIAGDSIYLLRVRDTRGGGGVASVIVYAAIVAGPHAGLAPAPYAAGPSGFFAVAADTCYRRGSAVADCWFVDLDDTYFRGGDVLHYFWYATDWSGGGASAPRGIAPANFPPASPAAAAAATGGLFEVSFLPAITWDPAYLARMRVEDPGHGDVEPTAAETANSPQANCILYYQHTTSNRRSGDANRTVFMYTLDRLGYRGAYDVYDVQGYGNANNQLAGRANVGQCSGYALIIEDDGRSNLVPNIPDGESAGDHKIQQATWYRQYLAQGGGGLMGTATLWVLGEDTAYESRLHPLFAADFGVTGIANDQGLAVNPDLMGAGSFTSHDGRIAEFRGDLAVLSGGCPAVRAYDFASATGTAVVTHRYGAGVDGNMTGAVVMNRNEAYRWNTIWMGFPWFDLGTPPGHWELPDAGGILAGKILACVLPPDCARAVDPTGTRAEDAAALPVAPALHPCVPNPFNPTTTIRFDLDRASPVDLRIYDIAGRRVRVLAAGAHAAGRHRTTWNGLDDAGRPVASGIYLCRLETPGFSATGKLTVMR